MSKPTRKLQPRDDRVTINHEFASVEEFVSEYVSNISRSGVFIKTKHPLDVGTRVNLRFTVIMDDLETIEGVGEVVRVSARPTGMGVVFVSLEQHASDLIDKLIVRRRGATVPGLGEGVAPGPSLPPVPPVVAPPAPPPPRPPSAVSSKPPPVPADALMKKRPGS